MAPEPNASTQRGSDSRLDRPELDWLLDRLRQNDVVIVAKYDRLSRSLQDLLTIVEAIRSKGAGFRSLAEDIDTTTPAPLPSPENAGPRCRGCETRKDAAWPSLRVSSRSAQTPSDGRRREYGREGLAAPAAQISS